MLKSVRKVSTVNMDRSEWLKRRKLSIGGSDASAVVGLNDYATPYTVWADKTNRLPEKPDNEAMRLGRDLEGYVASRFTDETGKKVRRIQAILYNDDYPYAHADVDRWVIGENAGLECKTTSVMNLKKFKNGSFPETYYVQCVHYMAITGAERWYLAVLVLGQGFHWFVIERDNEEIKALMKQESEFWECVENDIPPRMDGSTATTESICTIYSESKDNAIDLFGRDRAMREYIELKSTCKSIEKQMNIIKQEIMQDLGENEFGVCGAYSASWKTQSRNTFDVRKLAEDYPDIDVANYFKASTFRKFEIREEKNNG